MHSRMLLATVTTTVLFGGAFTLRRATPTESVAAVSSVQRQAPEQRSESVAVMTELVTAQTMPSPRVAAVASPSQARTRPSSAQKRSLFARLLLGSGDTRPEPFPRPGRAVSARP